MSETALSKYISNYEGEVKTANLLERYLKEIFPDDSLKSEQTSIVVNTHKESTVDAFMYDTMTDQFTINEIEEKDNEVTVFITAVITARTTGKIIEELNSDDKKKKRKRQGHFVYDHNVPLSIELVFDPAVYLEHHNLPPALTSHRNIQLNHGEDIKIDEKKIRSTPIEWENQ